MGVEPESSLNGSSRCHLASSDEGLRLSSNRDRPATAPEYMGGCNSSWAISLETSAVGHAEQNFRQSCNHMVCIGLRLLTPLDIRQNAYLADALSCHRRCVFGKIQYTANSPVSYFRSEEHTSELQSRDD